MHEIGPMIRTTREGSKSWHLRHLPIQETFSRIFLDCSGLTRLSDAKMQQSIKRERLRFRCVCVLKTMQFTMLRCGALSFKERVGQQASKKGSLMGSQKVSCSGVEREEGMCERFLEGARRRCLFEGDSRRKGLRRQRHAPLWSTTPYRCLQVRRNLSGPLNRLNAILSLLHPLDRYRAPSAIGSAIGRPLSRIQTQVGVLNRLVLNRLAGSTAR